MHMMLLKGVAETVRFWKVMQNEYYVEKISHFELWVC